MENILNQQQTDQFINEGYIAIPEAFSKDIAAAGRDILWKETGCNPDDPATWHSPVIRLGYHFEEPFIKAANTPRLLAAYDQLAGKGNWKRRMGLGTFPVRFPSPGDPGDTGWHVDVSFAGDKPDDYFQWRSNIYSKGRALLMLFLFSDIGEKDAPTRIRKGSHLEVARILAPYGDDGLSALELASRLQETANLPETPAIGEAGTVYLCHPFLAHAAQPHHGTTPRFLAQPPLEATNQFVISGADELLPPVALAISNALKAANP